jgi:NAD(P)-dependent dehydrogenase (short-subunit alcohol dehydrogenase family)
MGVLLWGLVGVIAVVAVARKRIFSHLLRGHVKPSQEFEPVASSVRGKKALIVGGTKGLGLAIARKLAQEGADVTVAGRSRPADKSLKFIPADLQTVKQQKAFAEFIDDVKSLDLLLFTQGILAPPTRQDNGEGIELDLAVSYISRRVILDELREKGLRARVFVMGFPGEDQGIDDFNGLNNYKVWPQHMNTVTANEALTVAYRKKFPDIEIYGLNPGLVKTDIRGNIYSGFLKYLEPVLEGLIGLLFPDPDEYAASVWPVISAAKLPRDVINYNARSEPLRVNPQLTDALVAKIWSDSDELIAKALKKH